MYKDQQIRLARKHEKQWAQMAEETDATFQEVFSQASSTDMVKLVPWCISSAIPLCYMNEVLATMVQQREDIAVTTTAPEPEGSQALAPSDSPSHQTGTPHLPVPPLLDIPFVGTSLVGCPFTGFIVDPYRKSRPLFQWCTWWSMQQVDLCWLQRGWGEKWTQPYKGDEDMPDLALGARPSTEASGQKPTSPPSSPTNATTGPGNGTVVGTSRSTADQDSESNATTMGPHPTRMCPERMWLTLIWSQPPGNCFMCLDTDEVTVRIAWRNTGRGYRLPVAKAKVASGLRLNSSGLATATRLCGDMTMRLSEWSRIVLLRRIIALSKCIRWQSELTS